MLATFVLFVLLRWVAAKYLQSRVVGKVDGGEGDASSQRDRPDSLRSALRQEALAWVLAVAVLGMLFCAVAAYAFFFGGIPQIHEWSR
jgi:uncharacterized membrane protein (DUF485 family)